MEKKLKQLFDYQRFEQNAQLEALMADTESRYARSLSDEELSLINAAGDPAMEQLNNSGSPFPSPKL